VEDEQDHPSTAREIEDPARAPQPDRESEEKSPGDEPVALRHVENEPEGGLPYRLTISEKAEAGSPHRLVIWLHPTGGSYNSHAEDLSPIFARNGFALLVMTRKDFRGWTYDQLRKLLGVVLPDVARIPGVDVRRPILMGFSAGGQVALDLWMTRPGLYGGVIIDAAYPVETREGNEVVLAPPSDEAMRGIPIFVVVGEKDVLKTVWDEASKPWSEAGVPLSIVVVPDKGHEWLFGDREKIELEVWLRRIPRLDDPQSRIVAPPQEEPAPAVQP
jgi:predicted esterase